MKFYARLKWHLKELNKTLSHQPSHYSSKRIERMILFVNAIAVLDLFIYKEYSKLTTSEIVIIFGAQMAYAGFQTAQIRKDKNEPKGDNEIPANI